MSIQTLYTAATGMNALQSQLDTIANNLANMETTGFKAGRANFEDLLYLQEKMPGAEDSSSQRTPTGIAIGTGSKLTSVQVNFGQGSLQQTNGPLDIAIQGTGFFRVKDPSGQYLYTRAGNFSVNANGNVVLGSASTGRLLDPPITLPIEATNVNISPAGLVTYQMPNSTASTQAGTIELTNFINPQGLLQQGENLFAESIASGSPQQAAPGQQGLGLLQQSSLEASNVQPVSELINLITTQRAFELNSQAVQAGDQIQQLINNLRRSS
ncbi:MAG: flagellar basal-body rod protein FlgG [Thermoguttaceae bacterium]